MTLIVRTRELEVYVIHNLQTTGGPLRTHFLISKKMSCYEICLCYVILPKLEFRTSILQFLIRMIKIYKIILPKLALIYDLNLNELKLLNFITILKQFQQVLAQFVLCTQLMFVQFVLCEFLETNTQLNLKYIFCESVLLQFVLFKDLL